MLRKNHTIKKVLNLISTASSTTMLGSLSKKWAPFKTLIATILSARAKDEVTELVAEELFKAYPDCNALANANPTIVKRIIHRIGFFNAKTKNIIATAKMIRDDFSGKVPSNREQLLKLPGVGRKVANCILVYSFDQDAIPVDIHVHRISNRLGWVKTTTPEHTEERLLQLIPKKHWKILNDTFVRHGKTICLPVSPKCSVCPVHKYCTRAGVRKSR
ncbi:MAG: endonuclease III [Candidatus Woesearchaeota archaeon]|nr:endonuclease III [Candidatus Woesearchaeota archaeon]